MGHSLLTPTHRYVAGALLALALRQAQIHQTRPLGSRVDDGDESVGERCSSSSNSNGSGANDEDCGNVSNLWTHENRGLLRPVFRFLDIDPKAWPGIEETAASSPANHHVGAFMRIIREEESNDQTSENVDQQLALTKAIDTMAMSFETSSASMKEIRKERSEYEHQCRERSSTDKWTSEEAPTTTGISKISSAKTLTRNKQSETISKEQSVLGNSTKIYQRKVVILYELLSACIADQPQEKKQSRLKRGYDARHRAALRLVATWFDIHWIKMEAMEVIVACSAMSAVKEEDEKADNSQTSESKWSKWKRGGQGSTDTAAKPPCPRRTRVRHGFASDAPPIRTGRATWRIRLRRRRDTVGLAGGHFDGRTRV